MPNLGSMGESDKRKYSGSDSGEADERLRSAESGMNIFIVGCDRFFPFFSFGESGGPEMIVKATDVVFLFGETGFDFETESVNGDNIFGVEREIGRHQNTATTVGFDQNKSNKFFDRSPDQVET